MNNKIIYHNAAITDLPLEDINKIIAELRGRLGYIYNISITELIKFFDELSRFWRQNKKLEKEIASSLKPLAEFISKDNIISMLNFSLRGDYRVLDSFVDFKQPKYVFSCQPRGLVVHWLAGNVPILGFYSIFLAMITKNVSLVKVSSNAYKELLILLDSFKEVETEKVKGAELIKTICAVLIDKTDIRMQSLMSQEADVRVGWGGQEAIDAIMNLKRDTFCEDVIFGPKYSYGIIDKESLAEYKKIAQRLAFDVSVFDQYACSSPHTVFVQKGGEITPLEFAEELARQMDYVNKKILRKEKTHPEKKMDILSIRAKYNMVGKVFSPQDTDWTVVYTEEEGLAPPCFSRVVFIKPIDDLLKLERLNTRKIQTIGCALNDKIRYDYMRRITKGGGDRCPKFGDTSLYEFCWDGFFPLDKMVRWVSVWKS